MTLIGNFSIKQRILLSMLILVVCIAGISLTVMNGRSATANSPETAMEERPEPRVQIARMFDLASQNRKLALIAVQYDPRNSEYDLISQPLSSLRPQVEQNLEELDQITQAFLASNLTVQDQNLINRVTADHRTFVEKGLIPVFEAVERDQFDEAKEVFYRQMEPAFARYRSGIDSLEQRYSDVAPQN
ncbi:Tar ligand binding domain-containing protein [uncultured Halopseudomonas sp.]|uniref:Tar ligand binding domain-containing protein n=1 Tax=uncultured Halopseudomonas sp. TaxID=2901193 RepID=UPI0030EF6DF4|tara:strand:+ start:2676 stop:3239 length:564 start_codon:yes stop_codon:yes gene_type:complete